MTKSILSSFVASDVIANIMKKIPNFALGKVSGLFQATKLAKRIAVKGDVVLFSPAGQQKSKYKDFKESGKEFKKILYEIYE